MVPIAVLLCWSLWVESVKDTWRVGAPREKTLTGIPRSDRPLGADGVTRVTDPIDP